MLKTLSFLLSSFVIQAQAFQMGELITGGTGCFGSSKIVAVSGTEGRYVLPLRVRVNKKSEVTFDRKSCQIRLPIDLNPNEKLQLLDLSQVVRVVGQKNLDIKTNLNVGFVGRSQKSLAYEVKTTEDNSSHVEILKADGLISESACGKSVMLVGQLNAFVNGAGSQAFVSTGAAILTLKVVSCE